MGSGRASDSSLTASRAAQVDAVGSGRASDSSRAASRAAEVDAVGSGRASDSSLTASRAAEVDAVGSGRASDFSRARGRGVFHFRAAHARPVVRAGALETHARAARPRSVGPRRAASGHGHQIDEAEVLAGHPPHLARKLDSSASIQRP